MKTILIIILLLIALAAFILGPRINKDIRKKLNYANTYAIQNVGTEKDLRVFNAGNDDGAKIIQYDHHNWECVTWQLIGLDENVFLLKNLYTQKSFEPSSSPKEGAALWQQTLGGSRLQHWEFLKQPDANYLIRLKGTDLYLTATSAQSNSVIVLMPMQKTKNQLWKLIRQNPII